MPESQVVSAAIDATSATDAIDERSPEVCNAKLEAFNEASELLRELTRLRGHVSTWRRKRDQLCNLAEFEDQWAAIRDGFAAVDEALQSMHRSMLHESVPECYDD